MNKLLEGVGFPGGSVVKNPPASARDMDSIPGSGRSSGGGNGNPLQYSCLGNPMDRDAWQVTVHRVTKNQTRLHNWHAHKHMGVTVSLSLQQNYSQVFSVSAGPWKTDSRWRLAAGSLLGSSFWINKSWSKEARLRKERERDRERGRLNFQFSSVQLLSCDSLFATPWTAAHQASLSITNSQSLPKHMSIESVMPSNHLILCRPLLLPPSIFPSIRVFSNESALHNRWPKYWSFSFDISPFNEYSGWISFRMDWLDLFAVQGTLKSLLQHHSWKASILQCSAFFLTSIHDYWKTIALTRRTFVGKVMSLLFNMLSRQSTGSLRVGQDSATSLSLFTFLHWRRKWQPTPVFLPGESQGRGSLVGCHLWGHTESDTTEAT